MPRKHRDFTGQSFGRWIVVGPQEIRNRRIYWQCKCACGTVSMVRLDALTGGATNSCGCINHEALGDRKRTHGHTSNNKNTPTYTTWLAMKGRCERTSDIAFGRYGAIGIAVCDRWAVFENFLEDMGERPPGTTLDRINSSKDYEPLNCRWATSREQSANRRSTKLSEEKAAAIRADTRSNAEIAASYGVHVITIGKVKRGERWPPLGAPNSSSDELRKPAESAA